MHSPAKIESMMKRLRTTRTKAIDDLFLSDPELYPVREAAMIAYDNAHAPFTTNLKMLAKIGIDAKVAALPVIFNGLAMWHIYLVGTDHLTNEQLRELLLTRVLLDKVRLVPPSSDMSEFIDLGTTRPIEHEDDEDYQFTPIPLAFYNDEDKTPIYRSDLLPKNSKSPGPRDLKTAIMSKFFTFPAGNIDTVN